MAKKVEQKFTMEQAVEELKKKEEAKIADRKKRLDEFGQLIQEAMKKTNCYLQVDVSSPLNDLRIIPIVND